MNHRKMLSGPSGDYEIDAVAEFTILDGANLKVIVECKRYSNPVPRDLVLTLWAKIQETSANKGMLFSTSGFQSGTLDFAKSKNIATITFVNGAFTYKTKSMNREAKPPPRVEKHKYCGLFVEKNGANISSARIENSKLDELSEWLKAGV